MENKNKSLYDNFEKRTKLKSRLSEETEKLPIFAQKQQIINAINQNQVFKLLKFSNPFSFYVLIFILKVIVVCAETGSGKTTQVPQYIFDDYISKMKGTQCNILITQPRRISAISVASRVFFSS